MTRTGKHSFRTHGLLDHEWNLWRRTMTHVAGVDEAGRGPLAGPVVAAAVMFPQFQPLIAGINDSKKLSSRQRRVIMPVITAEAVAIGVGIVSEAEIDRINILQASLKAMQLAVENLKIKPQFLLIDGKHAPSCHIPHSCIVKGDTLSMSIAAASIVAKVTRDELMGEYHQAYPQYDFDRNKGYPTPRHISAIRVHGLCPIHRRSFKPKKLLHDDDFTF